MLQRVHIKEGMTINGENFDFIKSRGEELYKSFTSVRCPYFNELVYFNSFGLEHLKFKRAGVERLPQDQYMRFRLLHVAPLIIKLSRTVQGVMRVNTLERVHKNGMRYREMQHSIFYEFIAVLDDVRVRVVVKRVENSDLVFWSIIPYWKNGKQGDRQLFDSGLQED